MANPVAVNEKGLTVLYEAPQPVVEYVLLNARLRGSAFPPECTATTRD